MSSASPAISRFPFSLYLKQLGNITNEVLANPVSSTSVAVKDRLRHHHPGEHIQAAWGMSDNKKNKQNVLFVFICKMLKSMKANDLLTVTDNQLYNNLKDHNKIKVKSTL